MDKAFFLMYALFGAYNDNDYFNLSSEEKINIDYMNECLFSNNKKINDASFNIMMLILEISENIDSFTKEEIEKRKLVIYEGLNDEEITVMEDFMYACINSMGIYSEEAKLERKQRNERNDK